MVQVSSIAQIKSEALQLTPSIRYRRSLIVFHVEGTMETFKSGLRWCDLWTDDAVVSVENHLFDKSKEDNTGWVFNHRAEAFFVVGVVKEGKKLRIVVSL